MNGDRVFISLRAVIAFAIIAIIMFSFPKASRDPTLGNGVVVLEEADEAKNSTSQSLWLNSGGFVVMSGQLGSSIEGLLPYFSKWRFHYALTLPVESSRGFRPQNVLRLLTQENFNDSTSHVYFKLNYYEKNESSTRNASNGMFLMSRYVDSDNLYYGGLRVDGAAVIKKKKAGQYLTLGYEPVIRGSYERTLNPNLMPQNQWFGVRMDTKTVKDGVELTLFLDLKERGLWQKVLRVTDDNDPLTENGLGGLRTDFMDVEFNNFEAKNLKTP